MHFVDVDPMDVPPPPSIDSAAENFGTPVVGLMNTFREQRVVGGFPGDLDSPVAEHHIERFGVSIDGVEVPGLRIDTDPHVYAVGADLGDRILTAVVAREHLPHVEIAFETRT